MPERYRVRRADGQVFETRKTPAAIRKKYPDATIVGRVVEQEIVGAVVVPFQGEQPVETTVAVVDAPADEPKPESKKAR